MRMHVTPKGIDWDRVKPELVDGLAAEVEAAALDCASAGRVVEEYRTGQPWKDRKVYHNAFTSEGGRTYCCTCARRRLEELRNLPALADALPATNAARFAAHVREEVAA